MGQMARSLLVTLLFLVGIVSVSAWWGGGSDDEHNHENEDDQTWVTCGSVIKLANSATNYRLHSREVNYGTGSGQQSVTGFPTADDGNSLWRIIGGLNAPCERGSKITQGMQLRLQHINTKKLLHSHKHVSPLSRQQEVSAFDGVDNGDNWEIVLPTSNPWKGSDKVLFKHADTGLYLTANKNSFGNPIPGQLEIACASKSVRSYWQAKEGIYFSANDEDT